MSSEAFAEFLSPWLLATGVQSTLAAWQAEYLAAYERQHDMPPRSVPTLRHIIARHGVILRGEERPPAAIVVLGGTSNIERGPDRQLRGDVELGVVLYAAAQSLESTANLLHIYAAVTRQMLFDRPVAGCRELLVVDEDYTPIVEQREQVLLGIDLTLHASSVPLGQWRGGPPAGATPRDDPYQPWPAAPPVETTHLDLEAQQ
ncbi:MAG: hypothetical protein QM679_02910 [Patulibacter sp.]